MEESSSSELSRDVSANASTSTSLKDEINIPSENKDDVESDELYSSFKDFGVPNVPDDVDYYDGEDDLFDEYGYHDESNCDIDDIVTMFEDIDLSTGLEVAFNDLDAVNQNDEIAVKFKSFKKFDSVSDPSDHHFCSPELLKIKGAGMEPTKKWTRRIQHEWRLLEKHLPETIYVRVYEGRLDLLRAAIVGPTGTPYHDGLFFFDIYFPTFYPSVPPMVHYHSRGLRLNPNLYACGKVCLSLLNTWNGDKSENWRAGSTMLQVLVSIQALILNEKPFFNEPGYETFVNTTEGEWSSLCYNKTVFVLSCKTMLYSLQSPPKHFESFVAGHFRYRGRAILMACIAYLQGAQIGCPCRAQERSCCQRRRRQLGDIGDEDGDQAQKIPYIFERAVLCF
ncbi:hypothetical protein HPP92_027880 [Vanilla planifolia]|uniref:E2 ubiquitin-conjugating enzyme n=1 Tax=Vanilla planifolia TaxID=51239 RepID=A0A835P7F6_VANPL|nr:hypothetical protein HPP92_027880 [Vanilla planifolia]